MSRMPQNKYGNNLKRYLFGGGRKKRKKKHVSRSYNFHSRKNYENSCERDVDLLKTNKRQTFTQKIKSKRRSLQIAALENILWSENRLPKLALTYQGQQDVEAHNEIQQQ